MTLSLYSAAATLANGEFVPASGHTANELSGWIRLDPPTVSLPPKGKGEFRITVAVPADATAGERYAVALAELPPRPGQGLVGLASRVGIRVYLSVGGGAEPPTDFQLKTFKPVFRGGRPGVDINACNTGGRALDLGGSLKLADGPGGVSAGPFASTQPATVAPGDCQDLTIDLDPKLPKGPWSATASLRSGTREKEATATITFPEGPGGQDAQGRPVAAKESGRTSDAPLVASLAVALFALAAAAAALTLRRRRRLRASS